MLTLFLQVTNRQTRRTVKTRPAATPVTMTTIELAEPPKSRPDMLPLTAFESVTPEIKKNKTGLRLVSENFQSDPVLVDKYLTFTRLHFFTLTAIKNTS